MAFYVFDLDGTLANLDHRRHLVAGLTKDWDAFFAACIDDAPIQPAIDLFLTLANTGFDHIEIWSGRSDVVRRATELWLEREGISRTYLAYMRPAGDHRPDEVLKRHFLADRKMRPDVVFDDRKKVVDMWRAEGITCFQVAPGDF